MLTKRYILLASALLVAMGIGAVAIARSRNHADAANALTAFTVPEHTSIQVTLDQALASNQSRPGDRFDATVAAPIVVGDKVIIPQGARAEGIVVDAHHSGRLKGRARLQLALQTIDVGGNQYDVRTMTLHRIGGNHKKRNFAWIGGGGGGGVLIGALAAGGKGALIGGPIGAGAGTAAAYFTGKKDIHLPAETRLTFRLAEPLTVEMKS